MTTLENNNANLFLLPNSKIIQLFYASKEYSTNTISSQLIKFVSQSTIKVEFELTDVCYALSNC